MKPIFPGAYYAHGYCICNALSFQIVLGTPIIIYAKSLGASSTILGVISAFAYLMALCQLPAAPHVNRYGYRRFNLLGWRVRLVSLLFIALLPLLAMLNAPSKIALLVVALFGYNLFRGIAATAWLPWLTELVPEHRRGLYLSIDYGSSYIGCLISMIGSAYILNGQVVPWKYALVFLFSALAALGSFACQSRIPDVPPSIVTTPGAARTPWRALLRYRAYLELMIFNFLFVIVTGSISVFTVDYLRVTSHLDVSEVIVLAAATFIGSLIAAPFLGPAADRIGSKPLLYLSTLVFGVTIAFWFLVSAGVIPTTRWLIGLLFLLLGAAMAAYNLGSTRLVMATTPAEDRNRFFAFFAVVSNISHGLTPIAWGMLIDVLGTYEAITGAFHWKSHSIYFAALFCLCIIAFAYISRLREAAPSRLTPSTT